MWLHGHRYDTIPDKYINIIVIYFHERIFNPAHWTLKNSLWINMRLMQKGKHIVKLCYWVYTKFTRLDKTFYTFFRTGLKPWVTQATKHANAVKLKRLMLQSAQRDRSAHSASLKKINKNKRADQDLRMVMRDLLEICKSGTFSYLLKSLLCV